MVSVTALPAPVLPAFGHSIRLLLLAVLCLAGCGLSPSNSPQVAAPTPAASAQVQSIPAVPLRIAVASGQILIAGPKDYCIDLPAARDGAQGSFVLIASCAAIAKTPAAGAPQIPAVLTATVSGPGAEPIGPQLAALNDFFRSEPGRAALSRTGRAANVTLLRAWGTDGVFYLAARDISPSGGQRAQPEFWRAVFDLKGRIVTLNVSGPQSHPLGPEAGRATLEAFVRQVQKENRGN